MDEQNAITSISEFINEILNKTETLRIINNLRQKVIFGFEVRIVKNTS